MAAALSNSMISVIVADEKNGIALLKQKGRQQMHIFFPIAIALTLAAPLLFKFVFSEAFYESGKLFSFTMLLTIPRLLFPQPILHAKGAQQWLTIAMFCEIVMLILFSFIGFHFFGLQGLVAAIVLSYLVEKLVLIVTLKYKFNIPLSDYLALQWFLFYSVTLLCSYLLTFVFY
jgi:O-antigen/teichoic acid export membrane protein